MSQIKKKKRVKKIVVSVVTVLVVGSVIVFATIFGSNSRNAANMVETKLIEVKKMKLTDSVSATGTVLSENVTSVYSTLNYNALEVNADLGDYVNEGDILCVLDTADLELDIAQQKAALSQSQRTALTQLQSSSRTLNEVRENIESGTNSALLNAQAAVTNTTLDLENKQRTYNEKLADYNNGTSSALINANASVSSTTLDLENKQRTYDNNKTLYENGVISKEEFTVSEKALEAANTAFNNAQSTLESVKISLEQDLRNLETSVTNAKNANENALKALNAAETSTSQEVESFEDKYASARNSANFDSQIIAIQKLERNLEKSIIKAPVSGTITAKYAEEGKPASGLLFIIEDTDNLKIDTKVKEYDISSIKPGLSVRIKTDATGETEFEGSIDKIAPTSLKDAQGNTIITSDVEFRTEVKVTKKTSDLKIGMVARLNIILNEKDNAFTVPFDALDETTDPPRIFVQNQGEDGKVTYKAVPVQSGMESDFYIEIMGEGIYEGMEIVADASIVNANLIVE